jgi:hypothetical protein
MRKRYSKGVGAIHLILTLALLLGTGMGYKFYKAQERKNELARLARIELLNKESEEQKADERKTELARLELLNKESEEQKTEMIKKISEQKEKILLILIRWDDALKLAGMTSRIALAEPLSQMQAIRRDMEEIKPNDCFIKATNLATKGMNNAIFGFEMFIKYPNSPHDLTSDSLRSSSDQIQSAKQEIDDCISVL